MNGDRDPTIADVLDELRSFRRAVLDEIAGLRHYVQSLDRDVATLIRHYTEGEEE